MKNLSRAAAFFVFLLAGVLSANFIFAAEKIDINTAPPGDLMKIIHIGEARALELISLRPFSSLDDLVRIKGIGEKRVTDIKKQGLAWVGAPAQPEPVPEASPDSVPGPGHSISEEIEVPAAEEPFDRQETENLAALAEQKEGPLFLIAAILAIFSGIIILVLKKSLK